MSAVEIRGYDICGNSDLLDVNFDGLPARQGTYDKLEDRIKSFNTWPNGVPIQPLTLAEAGLYYSGKSDRVFCFACEGGLKHWEANDDPWIEHAAEFPYCAFLKAEKGEEFISKARKIKSNNQRQRQQSDQDSGYSTSPQSSIIEEEREKSSQQIDDSDLCIICCDQPRGLVFIPCGHLVSCGRCCVQLNSCPTCRSEIKGLVTIKRDTF